MVDKSTRGHSPHTGGGDHGWRVRAQGGTAHTQVEETMGGGRDASHTGGGEGRPQVEDKRCSPHKMETSTLQNKGTYTFTHARMHTCRDNGVEYIQCTRCQAYRHMHTAMQRMVSKEKRGKEQYKKKTTKINSGHFP